METNTSSDVAEPESWYAKQEFKLLLHRLRGLPAEERARLQSLFMEELLGKTFDTETPHGRLSFVLLGRMPAGRAISLLTKQPATIDWIDSFPPDSIFWDVGANVGAYTLYAARRGGIQVVAFEPAAVNYFLLAANCEANNLIDKVDCLLVGLSDRKAVERLDVSQFTPGRSFRFRGTKAPQERSQQAALLVSMDQLVEEYGLTCPNYIKIDVPGLTERIIAGGLRMLERPEVRELHIEMKEQSAGGQKIIDMLGRCGLTIAGRHTHRNTTDITFARQGS